MQDSATNAMEAAGVGNRLVSGLRSGCSTVAVRGPARVSLGPLTCATFYLQNSAFPKWAMLGSNQRPPPCKLGRGSPGGSYRVREFGLYRRFLIASNKIEFDRVRVCPIPVAARLQHISTSSGETSP